MTSPSVTRRRSNIWWVCVVFLCLSAGLIGGIVGGYVAFSMTSRAWLDRMVGVIPTQMTVSAPPFATNELHDQPFDPIGKIPENLLNSAPGSDESAGSSTTAEVADPDPGELQDQPDDEYLCESVEIVTMPVDGIVWQLAEEVNKTKPVDWNALKTLYLDQEVKHLQPGVVIVIPIKGKLGPLATKIAFGD